MLSIFLYFHVSEILLLKNYLNALINDNFIHIINLALFKIKYLVYFEYSLLIFMEKL